MKFTPIVPVIFLSLIGCTTTYSHPEHGGTTAAGTLGILLDEKEICKGQVPGTIIQRTMGTFAASAPATKTTVYDSKLRKSVIRTYGPLNPAVVQVCEGDCRQARCEKEKFIHQCLLERGWTKVSAFNPRECARL